jgi:hypothetical protein
MSETPPQTLVDCLQVIILRLELALRGHSSPRTQIALEAALQAARRAGTLVCGQPPGERGATPQPPAPPPRRGPAAPEGEGP